MRTERFVVSVCEPGNPATIYHTAIATQAQVEDLKIAAEHFGLGLVVHRTVAVGTVLQWMNERKES